MLSKSFNTLSIRFWRSVFERRWNRRVRKDRRVSPRFVLPFLSFPGSLLDLTSYLDFSLTQAALLKARWFRDADRFANNDVIGGFAQVIALEKE